MNETQRADARAAAEEGRLPIIGCHLSSARGYAAI